MFIDTSALVAIAAREAEREEFLAALATAEPKFTSAVVIFEAAMVLSSRLDVDPMTALEDLTSLLQRASVEIVLLNADHARFAVQAFAKFGKGRGHPAQLNLADCLSYACARSRGVPLLYKGRDFSHTDLA